MEKDVLENFIEGLPDRISWKVSAHFRDIQTLEDAYDAVLHIDRKLRNRRQMPRNESPARWSRKDRETEDYRHRDSQVSYPGSPSRYDRGRHARTYEPQEDREEQPRATAWSVRQRSPSISPSRRTYDFPKDEGNHYSILKNSGKYREPELYCWHCETTGHDGKSCRKNPRHPKYRRDSRDSSAESNGSLNYNRAHRTGDTMSGNENRRQKTVHFDNDSSSRKHLPHVSKPKSQNWNQEKEHF
ncbi:uncharacterized protein LOC122404261 [Colletes gigas]|uniref:uncharacterized protein LOC122404261 n=1 Tax=Colletes gigas TaxID=935657 RepID=UPI001C9AB2CD|nr:uncharacterized protein LOC122404261 [Colletes gigas]